MKKNNQKITREELVSLENDIKKKIKTVQTQSDKLAEFYKVNLVDNSEYISKPTLFKIITDGAIEIQAYHKEVKDEDEQFKIDSLIGREENPSVKKLITFIALVFISILAQAQNFQWAKQYGTATDEIVNKIVYDASGNVYTVGSYSGTVDFDPGASVYTLTSVGNTDGYITKLDANGNFLWAKSFGNANYDAVTTIALDPAGNPIIGGGLLGTSDFDPDNVATYNLTSNGYVDFYIVKLTAAGTFSWAFNIGGTGSDQIREIVTDNAGYFFVMGTFTNTVDFDAGIGNTATPTNQAAFSCAFVLKYDVNGVYQWVTPMDSRFITIASLAVDNAQNIYLVGSFSNTADFCPGAGVVNLNAPFLGSITNDAFVLKLNSSGTFGWVVDYGTTDNDAAGAIDIDSNGFLIVMGYYQGTVGFGNLGSMTSSSGSDPFIIKLNPTDGTGIWAKSITEIGSYAASNMTLGADNSIYFTGYYTTTCNFNPGAISYPVNNAGLYDAFIVKLDSLTNFNWVHTINSTASEQGVSIVVTDSGNVYVAGTFDGTADFNPGADSLYMTTAGLRDAFVLKLGTCPTPDAVIGGVTGATSVCYGTSANYSIAPVNGATGYIWTTTVGTVINSGQNTTSVNISYLGAIGTKKLYVTPYNDCGYGPTTLIQTTWLAQPGISLTSANTFLCLGATTTINLSTSSGVTYTLTPTFTSGNSIAPIVTTNYIGTATGTNGCVAADTLTITVTPTPIITATVTPNSIICEGELMTITASGADTYTLSGGFTNGVPFAPSAATTSVSIEGTTNGCSGYNYEYIIVHPVPTVTLSPVDQTVAPGSTLQFIAASSSTTTDYQWQENDGSGFVNVDNLGQYSGAYTDTLTISNVTLSQNNYEYRFFTYEIGCMDTSAVAHLFVTTSVGVNSVTNDATIELYPNPVSEQFTITSTNYKGCNISIIDVLGNVVYQSKLFNQQSIINMSGQSKGIYFVKIDDENKNTINKKIIVR